MRGEARDGQCWSWVLPPSRAEASAIASTATGPYRIVGEQRHVQRILVVYLD